MITAFVEGAVVIGDGRLSEQATVLVEDSRIVEAAEGSIAIPRGARKIPLAGRTLVPGFIDCHIHICLDYTADPFGSLMKASIPLTAIKAANFARQTLMAGITTVRDLGGRNGVDLAVRDAVNSGLIRGPRMLASGQVICITGGHGWPIGLEVDGPTEVRKGVRQLLKAGVDVVKFIATGGAMTPGAPPNLEQLSEDELRAGIEEVHKAGRKTATHAKGTSGILNALRAGIDTLEHGTILNEEAVALMVERDVPLIPTLSALDNIELKGVAAGIPPHVVEKALMGKYIRLESLQMARQAGVKIAMGTDAGTPFNDHGANLAELTRLVKAGLSPMEALVAGTGTAARVLGLENDIGTIEPGKLADLVVLEGNPLENISLLAEPENLKVIMKEGILIKEEP